MTPHTFANRVLQTVVADGLDTYRGIFAHPGTVTHEYWTRALDLYRSLPRRHRKVVLEIMRQVTIDTVSEVFGIRDRTSALGGRSERFELTHTSGRSRARLNGTLQDLLIEKTETL